MRQHDEQRNHATIPPRAPGVHQAPCPKNNGRRGVLRHRASVNMGRASWHELAVSRAPRREFPFAHHQPPSASILRCVCSSAAHASTSHAIAGRFDRTSCLGTPACPTSSRLASQRTPYLRCPRPRTHLVPRLSAKASLVRLASQLRERPSRARPPGEQGTVNSSAEQGLSHWKPARTFRGSSNSRRSKAWPRLLPGARFRRRGGVTLDCIGRGRGEEEGIGDRG